MRVWRLLQLSRRSKSSSFFDEHADKWWNSKGELRLLRTMNRLRVPLIKRALSETQDNADKPKPLQGRTILDIGCGGGLLTEPLARLGARVTGIDVSPASIDAARRHSELDSEIAGNVDYICGSVEDVAGKTFDCVVASEVVEHVSDQRDFIQKCCHVAKSLVITTVNRTYLSYALAIVAAERILGLVPRGAHDWEKFVTPNELSEMLENGGASVHLVHGMQLNPLTSEWKWATNTDVNYAVLAFRTNEKTTD
ncbi:ubiquinone biosynthesis O-methyltransferase, mitochondrial-like isoform X2 [Oscarella lobularis]|uniref:ubiquinone biosynthesis O-methyltransferase, mitochondrial-like isoform X2 n=1 Tax=Oscarella lobularis TaxID=121494 RepID=UPI0033134CC9